jgi:hypothetical protein
MKMRIIITRSFSHRPSARKLPETSLSAFTRWLSIADSRVENEFRHNSDAPVDFILIIRLMIRHPSRHMPLTCRIVFVERGIPQSV